MIESIAAIVARREMQRQFTAGALDAPSEGWRVRLAGVLHAAAERLAPPPPAAAAAESPPHILAPRRYS